MEVGLAKIHVDPQTGHFMDPAGRIRIFHGLNSVEKQPPYYEANMRDPSLMLAMRDMGLNILRLGTMWTGWQPNNKESINTTYVDILEVGVHKIIQKFKFNRNIYINISVNTQTVT